MSFIVQSNSSFELLTDYSQYEIRKLFIHHGSFGLSKLMRYDNMNQLTNLIHGMLYKY